MADSIGTLIERFQGKAAKFGITLPAGAKETQITQLEQQVGQRLPDDVRALYLRHDGGGEKYWVENRELLSIARILDEWNVWKGLLDGGDFGDNQSDRVSAGVQPKWWIPGWLPVTYDGSGNHHIVDLDPAPGGVRGQLLSFWHDDSDRTIEGTSLLEWLANKAEARIE